jgi:hypothetical protein
MAHLLADRYVVEHHAYEFKQAEVNSRGQGDPLHDHPPARWTQMAPRLAHRVSEGCVSAGEDAN